MTILRNQPAYCNSEVSMMRLWTFSLIVVSSQWRFLQGGFPPFQPMAIDVQCRFAGASMTAASGICSSKPRSYVAVGRNYDVFIVLDMVTQVFYCWPHRFRSSNAITRSIFVNIQDRSPAFDTASQNRCPGIPCLCAGIPA